MAFLRAAPIPLPCHQRVRRGHIHTAAVCKARGEAPARKRKTVPAAPTLPVHLLAQVRLSDVEASKALRKALLARKDAVVVGEGLFGKVMSALSARERTEHALVLVGTQTEARLAAYEARLAARGAPVLLVGRSPVRGESWRRAGTWADGCEEAVIVVGSVGAVWQGFCDGGVAGARWLGRVRFLVVVGLDRVEEMGGGHMVESVVGKIGKRRKVVVIGKGGEELVRSKAVRIEWKGGPVGTRGEEAEVEVVRYETWGGVTAGLIRELRGIEEGRRTVVYFSTRRIMEWHALLARAEGLEVGDVWAHGGKTERVLGEFWKEGGIVFGVGGLAEMTGVAKADMVFMVGGIDGISGKAGVVAEGGTVRVLVCGREIREGNEEEILMKFGEGGKVGRLKGNGVGKAAEKAYLSWVGCYGGAVKMTGWSKVKLVEEGNMWAKEVIGFVPPITRRDRDRLHLRNVCGVILKPSGGNE